MEVVQQTAIALGRTSVGVRLRNVTVGGANDMQWRNVVVGAWNDSVTLVGAVGLGWNPSSAQLKLATSRPGVRKLLSLGRTGLFDFLGTALILFQTLKGFHFLTRTVGGHNRCTNTLDLLGRPDSRRPAVGTILSESPLNRIGIFGHFFLTEGRSTSKTVHAFVVRVPGEAGFRSGPLLSATETFMLHKLNV